MADDLRERIRRGDLAALADPALPLHLLADGPTAEWWADGRQRCAEALIERLGSGLYEADAANALVEWAQAAGYYRLSVWGETQWAARILPVERGAWLRRRYEEISRHLPEDSTSGPLALVARLHAIQPLVPDVDAALAILERYATR